MITALNIALFFSQILIIVIFISLCGYIFRKIIINFNHQLKFEEDGLYGFILIGFISLFLNFFIPLNLIYNTIFFFIILLAGIFFGYFNFNFKATFTKALKISAISSLLLFYSTVNRPDAWLYHLPYSNIINDHKIILGIANLHERFAHTSIFQYISSFFKNYLFFENGIVVPIALVASFFFQYLYYEFRNNFQKKTSVLYSYICFLILIISLYSFNRYSSFGNDAQAHIYFFFSFIILLNHIFLKRNLDTVKELSLIILFIFFIKPTFIVALIIPLILFINSDTKIKILKSFSFLFLVIFFSFWLLRNFLISGCFIYPLNFTCVNTVSWKTVDLSQNILENEAWSKGWPDQNKNQVLEKSKFTKEFNWLTTWFNNHFLFILKKISPVLIFFLINFLFFYFTKSLKKNTYDKNLFYLLIFSFGFILLWFLKFPVYRLGISQIYIFIIMIFYFIFFKNIKKKNLQSYFKYFNLIIFVVFFVVVLKNTIRIIDNNNHHLIPNIYFKNNQSNRFLEIYNESGILTHYRTKDYDLCGYLLHSPCTHLDKSFLIKDYFSYKIYTIN